MRAIGLGSGCDPYTGGKKGYRTPEQIAKQVAYRREVNPHAFEHGVGSPAVAGEVIIEPVERVEPVQLHVGADFVSGPDTQQ